MGKQKQSNKSKSNSKDSGLTTIPIKDIYFTHSKIYPQFSGCGKTIEQTLTELKTKQITISDLPFITVMRCSDNPEVFYSLNNRRLYVFKELEKLGLYHEVAVRIKPIPSGKKNQDRYTEERCSKKCVIMKMREKKVDGDENENETLDQKDKNPEDIVENPE